MADIYENVRNTIMVRLSRRFRPEEITIILNSMDGVFKDYNASIKADYERYAA